MTEPTIRRLAGEEILARLDELAEVLLDCVEGGASVSFMWPLPRERALAFWRGVGESVAGDERLLLVAEAEERIVGTVQLLLDQPPNQPHRADVAKMLVHRRARRRGIGEALMGELDRLARACGKSLLVLDTVSGSAAERLYLKTGWTRVGEIPDYALMPDGTPCPTTYFYKRLAAAG
ncbi:TPA: GNAT family N-acetyltransferase [Pseudomonas aeruginosa]|uniref:GNAT family N-acetyltransferase n=1 Tax=Pseudomonas TaxID=286 RepID=UPI00053E16D3|nr:MULTISPECIES: GNAT family N-acetyltransferase [Pseudomonas]EKL0659166.1 GNAT family N-acetyltransferase [Pseudomonas aeruginosa]EKL8242917.1 GNAT family N-acetyltransferase [Pseudomonas aeruginosa]EKL8601236.1 GNAT family N-acetyltransferase [Pseudomonas aeruginosa]EKP5711550.1 GNAT family N-acetyltransferase [Pseudomonas aeruginosa]EKT0601214.1 GNAT family N-acetyltransferase [Pseudomonas aeruginosa]